MGRPYMVMAVAVVAVVVNGLLNYGLIHGVWGLPRLGYIGSCTATLITLWAMTAAIGLEMRFTSVLKPFRLIGRIEWHILVELAALGWPIAFITAMEILLFSSAAMLIGRFGATQLAAHQISMSVASVTFMVPLAISQAVNVRVGYYLGQRSPHAARSAGIAAFTLGVGFMAAMATLLLTIPQVIAGFYISRATRPGARSSRLAVRLLTIAAFFQVFDGAQTMPAGRCAGSQGHAHPGGRGVDRLLGNRLPRQRGFSASSGAGRTSASGGGSPASLATVAVLLGVRFMWLSAA